MADSTHKRLLLIGLGIIMGALFVKLVGIPWFFDNFARDTREVQSGATPAALVNPLLAAERYLKRIGGKVKSIKSTEMWRTLPDSGETTIIPASGDTIIIHRYTPPPGSARRSALRKWIEGGGHLIVKADDSILVESGKSGRKRPSSSGRNSLLGKLGITLHKGNAKSGSIGLKFTDFEKKISVDFNTKRYLSVNSKKAKPVVTVPCGQGHCLLQYNLGDGLVTVVSNMSFIDNDHIGKHDHAMALALLSPVPPMRTWLVYDVSMPNLAELMWQTAPYALMALLAALLLWLWQNSGRLGPMLPSLYQPRRNIDEHLAASAGFMWRIDRGKKLIQGNQRDMQQAWFSKHFLLRSMEQSEGCAWIAARAGLAPKAVERALYGECRSERDFIELSSYLQILKKAL